MWLQSYPVGVTLTSRAARLRATESELDRTTSIRCSPPSSDTRQLLGFEYAPPHEPAIEFLAQHVTRLVAHLYRANP